MYKEVRKKSNLPQKCGYGIFTMNVCPENPSAASKMGIMILNSQEFPPWMIIPYLRTKACIKKRKYSYFFYEFGVI